ncbi:hypothetical protein Z968_11780 [Clostridium novyi A str. 4552]|uniref:Uncharacterized protein n=1 Tax=Clostridium novyi A str. 4552 TaxID=1444289 RepID=A0A0A0I117_CLONO|nr:hypothetical protein [Clostridium novyi]KEH95898.1 hypothetical protein Z962_07680 [Clostridium botulinum C/D str. BKT12695]KGM94353.1 hypothetical protein Z968_11780 [Clostridium novyi A str. 4552]
MNKKQEYELAKKELDELVHEGFLGKDILSLIKMRDEMDNASFLSKILWDYLQESDENIVGKEQINKYGKIFLILYKEAFIVNPQETVDVIANFWNGLKDNNIGENTSNYTEFIRINQEYKNTLYYMSKKDFITSSEKKKVAGELTNVYAKGVEFIAKIFTISIALINISNKQKYDIDNIDELTIYKKSLLFRKLSKGRYDIIIESINRDIRNAEAHLNLKYIPSQCIFTYKKKKGNKKINVNIRAEDMILNIHPKINWCIQAFVYSGVVFTLICYKGQNNKE